ncbi:uncharacterized protein LOC107810043 [Nicotiana tabacum]|uniref:Uncharacterized protein LOC107810043 n=2 Tax=Nicotiana TaxID=4085 RepID=A0A1S4BN33_TOBAC|nr:PREDICTED: uncharacterized protein LOC104245497 [Nicotiana sylvestris]XP_016490257.1 PREDICTED: uncharacterized protein LOC107810043 [Nicotiana tabacum]
MESHVVRRRMNMISAHLAVHDDISTAATHLFPMSCSSSLNSAIPRYDNRMNYARQSSSSQACFMRLNSSEQGMGSCSTESALPLKPNSCAKKSFITSEGPMYSRPTNKEFQYVAQGCKYNQTAAEAPKFARPSTGINEKSRSQLKERRNGLQSNGSEWSPRMDIAESGCMYIVSIELPGVNINDIKVEISDKSLIVSGNRSAQWSKVATCSNDSVSSYHKREIVQGPYRVFWPLPTNANKDSVSAEFVDGLLQITIPKL